MKSTTFLLTTLIAARLLAAGASAAQDSSPVRLSSAVDRDRITIGGLVHYTLSVEHDPAVKVEWPSLGSNLGSFEIRDYQVAEPVKQDGSIIEKIGYTISTFDTGAFVIPPIAVRYFVPPDTLGQALHSQPLEIYVASLKPSIDGDIRGLKAQIEYPPDYSGWIKLGAAAILLIVVIAGGVYYLRKRRLRGGGFLKPSAPPRPAHEVALAALAELEARQLFESGEVKVHFSRLSEILRAYLAARYFIPALEETTDEIIEHPNLAGEVAGRQDDLESILRLCDLAKFAKYRPSAEENAEALAGAYAFIKDTMIVLAPAGEAAVAAGSGDGDEVSSGNDDEVKSGASAEARVSEVVK